jgi:antitoxin component YwqK of YwqJK toxin-antitoxin module
MRGLFLTVFFALFAFIAHADYPERADVARAKGKKMMVKEWKTTPDGKKKWVDHAEVYNANGQLIEEAEYSDFGTRLAWRAEFEYNDKGELVTERIYNERNKLDKVRKFEYNDSGVCVRRLNYSANGVLNSYRQFEFVFE